MRGSLALRHALAIALSATAVAACGASTPTAAQTTAICDVRTSFVAARDQAQRAFNAAINGDAEEADDKALSATAAAVDAQARLKRMPAQLQSGDAARALLDSYDHIRLAATAVRGGPDGDNYSPSTAQKEISAATGAIAKSDASCAAK